MRPHNPHIEAEIRRIAQDAIALGWSPELLWGDRWNIYFTRVEGTEWLEKDL